MIADFLDKPLHELVGYALFLIGIIVILVIQSVYYFRLILIKRKNKDDQTETPISIIVFVHNEESRIESFLTRLLQLNYTMFEVIVVDMYSGDNTLTIMGALERQNTKLKIRNLKDEIRTPEKMAINIALKAANNDWCVFLSPDFEDISPDYLRVLNNEISDGTSLVMGYYNNEPNTGLWQRVERFFEFFSSAAYSTSGVPVLYQQLNLAFKRQLYFDVDGFRGYMNSNFANMELIFNRIKHAKVGLSISPETILKGEDQSGSTNFGELIQKRLSIRKTLSLSKKLILKMSGFAILFIIAGFGLVLFSNVDYWIYLIIPPAVLLILQFIVIMVFQKQLNEKGIFYPSMIYLLVRPFINTYHSLKFR